VRRIRRWRDEDRLREVAPPAGVKADAAAAPEHGLIALQRTAGNAAVTSLVQGRAAGPVVQRWVEYTTEYAIQLADAKKITIFDDRLDHVLERHGPEGTAKGASFHRFYSGDKATIRSYVIRALRQGRVTKSPGSAFDFEYTFDEPIGEDTAGEKVSRIRVVVVQNGKVGDRGKVQTAYPIP
jgi:hypothetical protein